jgi:hypothetical protein
MKTLQLLLLTFALPAFAQDGFKPLFNGKDLSGWDGNRDSGKLRKVCSSARANPASPRRIRS